VALPETTDDNASLVGFDPELSWSEKQLPEHERTKHVHRLHPYLGKFVPQLVEVFLHRYFDPGQVIADPFAGSGTTLVECSTFGASAVGVDVSAFNALLCRVKTARYDPQRVAADLTAALARLGDAPAAATAETEYLRRWFHPDALAALVAYRAVIADYPASSDLMRVVLCRAARSSRLTAHFNLDSPRAPQTTDYYCHKHARICSPTGDAHRFLRRYTTDTIRRVSAYHALRRDGQVVVHHADARSVTYGSLLDGVITSPPYPGRLDYHEQHRYAFDLLGLPMRRDDEIGAAHRGASRAAISAYSDAMSEVFAHTRRSLRGGAPVVIVVDDPRGLYDEICVRAGLTLRDRRARRVNRRTGRRGGVFFEQILVATA
jgi:hypothetical protein